MLAPPSGYEELFIANNKSTDLHTHNVKVCGVVCWGMSIVVLDAVL